MAPEYFMTPINRPSERSDNDTPSDSQATSLALCIPNKPLSRGIKRTSAALSDIDYTPTSDPPTHHPQAHDSPSEPASASKRRASMPKSFAETTDDDKLLLRLKDMESRSWSAIEAEMRTATGRADVTAQALRARYRRLKAGLSVMADEDVERFRRIKQAVEEKFESEKWGRISDEIVAAGGEKFTALALRQKWKELKI